MIKALVLEDERAAQEVLQGYIDKTPFISCLGIYESGLDIPHDIIKEVDVLFLDIQLPELNGLSFLKTLNNPPKVIVTTAYADYAIEAFEEAVTDYLVKPFPYERFFKAINRVRNLLSTSEPKSNQNLFLYADKTTYKVRTDDILYLSAEVDYVKFVTENQEILVLDSLKNWDEKLSKLGFIRIHRSYIVNNKKIEKVSGNQVFINEKALPIGKSYKANFLDILKL